MDSTKDSRDLKKVSRQERLFEKCVCPLSNGNIAKSYFFFLKKLGLCSSASNRVKEKNVCWQAERHLSAGRLLWSCERRGEGSEGSETEAVVPGGHSILPAATVWPGNWRKGRHKSRVETFCYLEVSLWIGSMPPLQWTYCQEGVYNEHLRKEK